MTKRKNNNATKALATRHALSTSAVLSVALVYQHFGLTAGEARGVMERASLTPVMTVPSGRGVTHYYERSEILGAMQAEVDRRASRRAPELTAEAIIEAPQEDATPCPPWGSTLQDQMDALLRTSADLTAKVDRLIQVWGLSTENTYQFAGETA